jgi:hypothetical protein
MYDGIERQPVTNNVATAIARSVMFEKECLRESPEGLQAAVPGDESGAEILRDFATERKSKRFSGPIRARRT